MRPSPFVKWAGGKSQLLETLVRCVPRHFDTYYEPFLGGGALFFRLLSLGHIRRAVISDANADLMNCYIALRDSPGPLIAELAALQEHASDKDFFYRTARPRFNEISLRTGLEGNVEKAALLIYINKTCYNGLYRVNSRGKFNVPWGRYRHPRIFDEGNVMAVSRALNRKGIDIRCCDYAAALAGAGEGDFAYLDPPYQPLSPTALFTQYTTSSFTEEDQKDLAAVFRSLDSRGCRVLLSNSYSPLVRALYREYLERGCGLTVEASRQISCKACTRSPVPESLIGNYVPGQPGHR